MNFIYAVSCSMMRLKSEGRWPRTPLRGILIIMKDGQPTNRYVLICQIEAILRQFVSLSLGYSISKLTGKKKKISFKTAVARN